MQYTLSNELNFRISRTSNAKVSILQVSQGSGNVCLALLSAYSKGLRAARNVYVRVGQGHYNIAMLVRAINDAPRRPGVHPLNEVSVARLYSLSANDFQLFCSVATNKVMVRAYCALHGLIGDLSSVRRCHALFYYTFSSILFGGAPSEIPLILTVLDPSSDEWKKAVRQYIFFHPRTKCISSLPPQNEDLTLVHRR